MAKSTPINLHTRKAMATEEPEYLKLRGRDQPPQPTLRNPEIHFLYEALARDEAVPWAVHEILPSNSHGVIYGPSGAGKTFIAVDLALSVAAGRTWHNSRFASERGPVIYLAHESYAGVIKRMVAWCLHNRVRIGEDDTTALPIAILNRSIPLYDARNAEALHILLDQFVQRTGVAPSVIVNDTLSRSFVPGDEDESRDMSLFLHNCDHYIREPYNATLVHVHHTGHATQLRARGSSALRAAADFEYRVVPHEDGVVEMAPTKQKEVEMLDPFYLKLEQVELRHYERPGESATSAVISRIVEDYVPASKPRRLSKAQTAMLESLRVACRDTEWHARREVMSAMIDAGVVKGANPWARFDSRIRVLVEHGHVQVQGEYLRVAQVASGDK